MGFYQGRIVRVYERHVAGKVGIEYLHASKDGELVPESEVQYA